MAKAASRSALEHSRIVDPAGITPDLSRPEFEAFRALILARTGIALGPHKRALLQVRLGTRLRALGLASFGNYRHLLVEQDPEGDELARLVNAVTTNKTEFYREARHFTYLAQQWVPEALERAARDGQRIIRIWSAGCSSGEEPYTIAMTLADALPQAAGWSLRILASDINTEVLSRATAGIYRFEDVRPIPRAVLRRHFLRGRGTKAGLVRIRPELRQLVRFRSINLIEDGWPIETPFDLIFCRNVLIYFDQPTQQRVLERLVGCLKEGGRLVLGHSEGVHGMVSGLRHAGSTIYHKESEHAGNHPDR